MLLRELSGLRVIALNVHVAQAQRGNALIPRRKHQPLTVEGGSAVVIDVHPTGWLLLMIRPGTLISIMGNSLQG